MDTEHNKWHNIQSSGQEKDDPAESNKAEKEPVWAPRQNGRRPQETQASDIRSRLIEGKNKK